MEEAPISLAAWLGQRRRWLKGWLQTALVQSRQLPGTLPSAGRKRSMLGGLLAVTHALSPLLYPVSLLVVAAAGARLLVSGGIDAPASAGGVCRSAAGSDADLDADGLCWRTPGGAAGKPLDVLLIPAYLLLISAAGILAAFDFARRPFHWRKTQHGLSRMRPSVEPLRRH